MSKSSYVRDGEEERWKWEKKSTNFSRMNERLKNKRKIGGKIHQPPSTIIPILFNDILLFSISTATHINYNKFESLMKWVMGLKATNKSESWSFNSISQQYQPTSPNIHIITISQPNVYQWFDYRKMKIKSTEINGNQHKNKSCDCFLVWNRNINHTYFRSMRWQLTHRLSFHPDTFIQCTE